MFLVKTQRAQAKNTSVSIFLLLSPFALEKTKKKDLGVPVGNFRHLRTANFGKFYNTVRTAKPYGDQ